MRRGRHFVATAATFALALTGAVAVATPAGAGPLAGGSLVRLDASEGGTVAGAYLYGTVTLENVSAYAGFVDLLRWEDEAWEHVAQQPLYTQSYYFGDLEPGTYTLGYRVEDDGPYWRIWGGSRELAPARPSNSFEVEDGFAEVDFPLEVLPVVSGTVRSAEGPLADAKVSLYAWDEDSADWQLRASNVVTDAQGGYRIIAPAGHTYTVRATRSRYAVGLLGGGVAFTAPDAGNSGRFDVGGDELRLGDVTLLPRESALGRHAGQTAPYCRANELVPADDASSGPVTLPFAVTLFGRTHTEIYVNNNGNVTFDAPLSAASTPAFDGGTSVPIIAPFLADVDTRDTEEADVVTYGASPDGTEFCVTWANVEPYEGFASTGLVNTFQLVLTSRQGAPGRAAGDVDVTFNYDEITWDAGVSGDAATAGLAAGTGAAGSVIVLEGSRTSGAFLDGGTHALVAGHRGTDVAGRYVFELAGPPPAPQPTPTATPTSTPTVAPTVTPTVRPTTAAPSPAPASTATASPGPSASTATPTAKPTATPAAPTIGKGKVTITGRPAVGAILTAKRTGWKRASSYSTQWFRNGKAIPRATSARYRLVAADLGKRITARVTARHEGAKAVAVTSRATSKVGRGTGKLTVKASSKKARTATLKVTATRAGLAAKRVTGKVTVREGKKVLGSVKLKKGKATLTLKKLRAGKHTLTITYPRTKTHVALTKKVKVRVR